MTAESVSRWARKFVLVSAGFLVAWQVAELAGAGRRSSVALGLLGFVFHTVFGKAYSLIPSYFDRELATPWALPVHLPLTTLGAVGLAVAPLPGTPGWLSPIAAAAWALGVAVFLGAIGWTVRDNPTGRETGTSEANAERRPVDRAANAFVPVALAYLAVGSYGLLAVEAGLPWPLDAYLPRITHLLAAGGVALLLFAVGFRLLTRFTVEHPPRALVVVVLPSGAVGPAILAATLAGGSLFPVGAVLEAAAVAGFAAVVGLLVVRTDRDRVGFYGALAGAASGVLAALLGLSFAFSRVEPALVSAHLRLNLLGFLGLTIVGVAYQFYPPAVGSFRGASDRTAGASIGLLAAGLLVEVAGLVAGAPLVSSAGRVLAAAGAVVYAGLLAGLFYDRYHR